MVVAYSSESNISAHKEVESRERERKKGPSLLSHRQLIAVMLLIHATLGPALN